MTYETISRDAKANTFGGPVTSTVPDFGVVFKPHSDGGYPVWGFLAPEGKRLMRVEIDLAIED